jgi:hypothetical protein
MSTVLGKLSVPQHDGSLSLAMVRKGGGKVWASFHPPSAARKPPSPPKEHHGQI